MDRVSRSEKKAMRRPFAEFMARREAESERCDCRDLIDEGNPHRRFEGLASLVDSWSGAPTAARERRADVFRLLRGEMAEWKRKALDLRWRRVAEALEGDAEGRANLISRIHTAQHHDEWDRQSRERMRTAEAQWPGPEEMKQLRAAARAGVRSEPIVLAIIDPPKGSLFAGPLVSWATPEELAQPSRKGPSSAFDTPTEMLMSYFGETLRQRASHAAGVTSDVLQWFMGRSKRSVVPRNIHQTWERQRSGRTRAPVQSL